jgi:hypothetical protein
VCGHGDSTNGSSLDATLLEEFHDPLSDLDRSLFAICHFAVAHLRVGASSGE